MPTLHGSRADRLTGLSADDEPVATVVEEADLARPVFGSGFVKVDAAAGRIADAVSTLIAFRTLDLVYQTRYADAQGVVTAGCLVALSAGPVAGVAAVC